jgi:hypothetical protein
MNSRNKNINYIDLLQVSVVNFEIHYLLGEERKLQVSEANLGSSRTTFISYFVCLYVTKLPGWKNSWILAKQLTKFLSIPEDEMEKKALEGKKELDS